MILSRRDSEEFQKRAIKSVINSALGSMADSFCCSLRRGGESLCSRLNPAWRCVGCSRVSLGIRGHSGCHLLLGLFSFAGKGLNSLQGEKPLAMGLVADGGDREGDVEQLGRA